MPNTEKQDKVQALKERIEGSGGLLLAEYRGLSVHDSTELRRSLAGEARFQIAKNTLLKRAAGEAGIEGLDEYLVGPTAVAFVEGDVVATAKRLVDAAKRFPALVLKGGYMEGKVLGPDEAKALANLESREVMLSKIAGLMKGEMSRAASMFQALQSRFVGLMDALKDKLPAEEAPAAEPEAAAEAPAEAEAEAEAKAPEAEAPAEPETESAAEPAPEAEAEPAPEPKAEAEPAPEPEAEAEAAPADETTTQEEE